MKSKRLYLVWPVLAIAVLCAAIFAFSNLHEPIVGDVPHASAAERARFLFGDRILAVNSGSLTSWEEFILKIRALPGQNAVITVQRLSGGEDRLDVTIANEDGRGEIAGLSNEWKVPVLGLRANSPLRRYGVSTGDVVLSINGSAIRTFSELEPALGRQSAAAPLNMDVRTGAGKTLSIAVAPLAQPYTFQTLGIDNPEFFVSDVKTASPASKLGVQKFDRVYLVQGQPLGPEFQAKRLSAALKIEDKLQMDVIRGDQVHHLTLPKMGSRAELSGGVQSVFDFLGLVNLARVEKSDKTAPRRPLVWWRYKIGGKS